MANRATSEVVAIAWLLGVSGITADADHVGVTLPGRDDVTGRLPWEDTGFVQFVAVVGGTPGMYVPERTPVIQLDFWAANLDSGFPPWGKARELAELILADTYDTSGSPGFGNRDVSTLMPDGYNGAYVQSVWPMSEPRRVPNDAGSYARLTMDVSLAWVEL
jgi:hypothetical protein